MDLLDLVDILWEAEDVHVGLPSKKLGSLLTFLAETEVARKKLIEMMESG